MYAVELLHLLINSEGHGDLWSNSDKIQTQPTVQAPVDTILRIDGGERSDPSSCAIQQVLAMTTKKTQTLSTSMLAFAWNPVWQNLYYSKGLIPQNIAERTLTAGRSVLCPGGGGGGECYGSD